MGKLRYYRYDDRIEIPVQPGFDDEDVIISILMEIAAHGFA